MPNSIRDAIQETFEGNLRRVEALLILHSELRAGGTSGASDRESDLLRSAVVFLHASLEDLLRHTLAWRWPLAGKEYFEDVFLVGCSREKFKLQELVSHRGKSVDEVLAESVDEALERFNFNHPGDIRSALGKAGVGEDVVTPYAARLRAMMSRRHLIVHRADRNELRGSRDSSTTPLPVVTVEKWRDAVRGFGDTLLSEL